jgi:hypothetical protein
MTTIATEIELLIHRRLKGWSSSSKNRSRRQHQTGLPTPGRCYLERRSISLKERRLHVTENNDTSIMIHMRNRFPRAVHSLFFPMSKRSDRMDKPAETTTSSLTKVRFPPSRRAPGSSSLSGGFEPSVLASSTSL